MMRKASTPSSPRPALRWAKVLLLVVLGACTEDDEVTYEQFNADDDEITIAVGGELLDAVTVELHSTTGEVVIGSASVDPGGGPIGTEHTILVQIDDAYEDEVDRVSVRAKAEGRGDDEYDLQGDSADEGLYKRTLVSQGEEGETREDTFVIRVWDIVDDTDGQTDTSDTAE